MIAIIYAVFLFWYGGNGCRMTKSEVAHFVEIAKKGGNPEGAKRIEQFASTEWDVITFIRYCSRADFLEFI